MDTEKKRVMNSVNCQWQESKQACVDNFSARQSACRDRLKNSCENHFRSDEIEDPVKTLQEICCVNNWDPPKYSVIGIGGPSRTFKIKCQLHNYSEVGMGKTVISAKELSAKKVLMQLIAVTLDSNIKTVLLNPTTNSYKTGQIPCEEEDPIIPMKDQINSLFDLRVGNKSINLTSRGKNPVALLQDYCKKKNWPLPSFEALYMPNTRMDFVVYCKLLNYVEKGCGFTLDEAKSNAAEKLWGKLFSEICDTAQVAAESSFNLKTDDTDSGDDVVSVHTCNPSSDSESGVPSKFTESRSVPKSQNSTTYHMDRVTEHVQPCELSLFEITPSNNKQYSNLLEQIAKKFNFQIYYEDVTMLTSNMKHQCILHVGTDPPTVYHGFAKSPRRARWVAARNAFLFLKIKYWHDSNQCF